MDYIDPYNFPENAIRDYDINGGSVTPDLFNGTIFRVSADESFTLERLRNQIDGAKFFIEVYNQSSIAIYMYLNEDYIASDQNPVVSYSVSANGIGYFEAICRRNMMVLYDVGGTPPTPGDQLFNPLDGSVLINPATGLPLLNSN